MPRSFLSQGPGITFRTRSRWNWRKLSFRSYCKIWPKNKYEGLALGKRNRRNLDWYYGTSDDFQGESQVWYEYLLLVCRFWNVSRALSPTDCGWCSVRRAIIRNSRGQQKTDVVGLRRASLAYWQCDRG